VIQSVLHLHMCDDPASVESTTAAESAPAESAADLALVEFADTADPTPAKSTAAESAVEPLHSVADSAVTGAALIETS
jgi:hypothetical protein